MRPSLFLIGAGFNVDAGRRRTPSGTECWYPLVSDVAPLCFGLAASDLPPGKSIDGLFAESSDRQPMKSLADKLMEADYYLASRLISEEMPSCHREFFKTFAGANFLTFNYDSLPEILLFKSGRWFPEDGYGVPVQAELTFGTSLPADRISTSQVLHLHGSFCLRATDFQIEERRAGQIAWLKMLDRPQFKFDPDCLSPVFFPYRRVLPDPRMKRPKAVSLPPFPTRARNYSRRSCAKFIEGRNPWCRKQVCWCLSDIASMSMTTCRIVQSCRRWGVRTVES